MKQAYVCISLGWDVETSSSSSAPPVAASSAATEPDAVPTAFAATTASTPWDVTDSESSSAEAGSNDSWPPVNNVPNGPEDERLTELASRKVSDKPEAWWFHIIWTFMLQFRVVRWIARGSMGLPAVNRDLLCAGTCPELYADDAFVSIRKCFVKLTRIG